MARILLGECQVCGKEVPLDDDGAAADHYDRGELCASVGDRVMVRSDQDHRVAKWTEVQVYEIKFGDFFYLGLV